MIETEICVSLRINHKNAYRKALKARGWSKTGIYHISLNIQQIMTKFATLVYCVKIRQHMKLQLFGILVAMVTENPVKIGIRFQ